MLQSCDTLNSEWYTDVPGINERFELNVTLTPEFDSSGDPTGVLFFRSSAYFPLDDMGYADPSLATPDNNCDTWVGPGDSLVPSLCPTTSELHNYFFTSEIHIEFSYLGGENFAFTGDDDVWVFINNQLVVDVGGVHPSATAAVALDSLGLTVGNLYNLDIFHAERQNFDSNFNMETSIRMNTCPPGTVPSCWPSCPSATSSTTSSVSPAVGRVQTLWPGSAATLADVGSAATSAEVGGGSGSGVAFGAAVTILAFGLYKRRGASSGAERRVAAVAPVMPTIVAEGGVGLTKQGGGALGKESSVDWGEVEDEDEASEHASVHGSLHESLHESLRQLAASAGAGAAMLSPAKLSPSRHQLVATTEGDAEGDEDDDDPEDQADERADDKDAESVHGSVHEQSVATTMTSVVAV